MPTALDIQGPQILQGLDNFGAALTRGFLERKKVQNARELKAAELEAKKRQEAAELAREQRKIMQGIIDKGIGLRGSSTALTPEEKVKIDEHAAALRDAWVTANIGRYAPEQDPAAMDPIVRAGFAEKVLQDPSAPAMSELRNRAQAELFPSQSRQDYGTQLEMALADESGQIRRLATARGIPQNIIVDFLGKNPRGLVNPEGAGLPGPQIDTVLPDPGGAPEPGVAPRQNRGVVGDILPVEDPADSATSTFASFENGGQFPALSDEDAAVIRQSAGGDVARRKAFIAAQAAALQQDPRVGGASTTQMPEQPSDFGALERALQRPPELEALDRALQTPSEETVVPAAEQGLALLRRVDPGLAEAIVQDIRRDGLSLDIVRRIRLALEKRPLDSSVMGTSGGSVDEVADLVRRLTATGAYDGQR